MFDIPPEDGATPPRATAAQPGAVALMQRYASHAVLALAVVLAIAGGVTWLATRPSPRRIEIIIPTPAPVVVHISGAVTRPGVYELPPGSRVADAIAAAGGTLSGAQTGALNLAARVSDGLRLDIPAGSAASGPAAPSPAGVQGAPASPAQGAGALIDLNTATLEQLVSLPGIGDALGKAIIAFRTANGPLRSVDDLLAIDRIGPKTVDAIRPFVLQQ
jgi:competence protein ComEA